MTHDEWLFAIIGNVIYLLHRAEAWWWKNIRTGGPL